MRHAKEWHHVMFAMRRKWDVAHENQIVVAVDFLEDAGKHVRGVCLVAGKEFLEGLDDAFWRVAQSFPRGIVAAPAQKHPHRRLSLLAGWRDRQYCTGLGLRTFKQGLNHGIQVAPPKVRASLALLSLKAVSYT